jgi:gliding motility-associated-like protein
MSYMKQIILSTLTLLSSSFLLAFAPVGLKSGTPQISFQSPSGLDYLSENCSSAGQIVITLTSASPDTLRFLTSIAGTASLGVDYVLTLPSEIEFLPGQTQVSFPITATVDNFAEPTETILISLIEDPSGAAIFYSLQLKIEDNLDIEISGGDTLKVCRGLPISMQATGGVNYLWRSPLSGVISNQFIANPTYTPQNDTWLHVAGSIGGLCAGIDSVFIQVLDVDINISNTTVCLGASVQLESTNDVGAAAVVWSPATGLSNPNIANPVATPDTTTTYTATVTQNGCTATDVVVISVDTLFLPVLTTTDTTICEGASVILAEPASVSTTTYIWSPAIGLSNPNIASPVASPTVTTTYQVISTSANNTCRDTATVVIEVTPSDVNISGSDTVFICLGTTVPLTASISPIGGSDISWSPSFFVNPSTGQTTTVTADESTWVYARYSVNGCQAVDSVFIRVDSLPANQIIASPVKPFYCPGDTVTLLSPTYEPAQFPDINLFWPPAIGGMGDGGVQTPDSLWNMVLLAEEGTWTFTRYITNNACRDTSTVTILVAKPVEFTVTGNTYICLGASSQLTVTSNPPGVAVEWKEPIAGLSCTDCPNPIATPTQNTTYTVSAKDEQCPSNGSITIEVTQAAPIGWPEPAAACPGATTTTLLNSSPNPSNTYSWVGPGITNSTSPDPQVIISATSIYTVTVTNDIGCTRIDTKTIELLSATVDAGPNQIVCEGATATLNATATGSPGNFTWSGGLGPVANPSTLPVFGIGVYTVTYNYGGTLGCTVSDSVRVSSHPFSGIGPITLLDSLVAGQPICYGTTVRARVTTQPPNLPVIWLVNGEIQPQTTQTVSLIPSLGSDIDSNFVDIQTRLVDQNGCVSENTPVTLLVKRCFELPNAFTPNNDMENDTFGPVNPYNDFAIPVEEFKIFNRWGDMIWEATETQLRWDGLVNGKQAPIDTYIYHIVVLYPNGITDKQTGEITLLR